MKKQYIYILLITGLFSACAKEQYKGSPITEAQKYELSDEHNNYHVRETKKVLAKNEIRNEKREEKSSKEHKKMLSLNLAAKKTKYKKRQLVFDFY